MKTTRRPKSLRPEPNGEVAELRMRLAEANDTLRAIRSGEVDSMIVAGKQGDQVFTLEGAEHTYRALIESMSEGALTLTPGKMILYANRCFARMVKCPLEQVIGGSLRRFLSATDRVTLRRLLRQPGKSNAKIQVSLTAADGTRTPVQISICELADDERDRTTIGMVVTDMGEARRAEERLRALTHRVVQVQEAERGSVALELHDNITQVLCAILFRSQALAVTLSARDGPAKKEAIELRDMLGNIGEEVERISRTLRPGVLEQLGLAAVLKRSGTEFARRTGMTVTVACAEIDGLLPAGAELGLYRIFEEAMKNVERHSRARIVTVQLKRIRGVVQLSIEDDGVGFDPARRAVNGTDTESVGLLGMRERAAYVNGTLEIKSGRRSGTKIVIRVPVGPTTTKAT
jgi:PAS domain S-box-containing protein